ncbi:MAG TPA: glycosyltransferase [Pyrinomonadaceae bacterium]|jgi:glycosyltransferase involved in cell wall biosynthesis
MRILWLKTELLHPVDKGGKIRTYNMLKELKSDHHITYLTLDDGSADDKAPEQAIDYCHDLICIPHRQREKFSPGFYVELFANLGSRLPYAIKKYESPSMRNTVSKLVQDGRVDVVICDFLAPAINVARDLNCPSVLFQHNVEAMIWKRHFEVQANQLKKSYLRIQWQKMRSFELDQCRRFDAVVAVSAGDREQIKNEYSVERVFDVPTGVDTEFFRSSGASSIAPHNLVFTGSMDWLPNEDAMNYFIGQVLPLIRSSIPDVSLTVVGRNPYPSLLEMSKRDSAILVTGRVDDVRPFMEKAAVYIVPLRIGGGTRLKIFEAMSMKKAIVSTTVGAEGLPVSDGNELCIADAPGSFAAAVIQLLTNPELAEQMGERAGKVVREKFGWAGVAKRFAEICESALNESSTSERAFYVRNEQPAA